VIYLDNAATTFPKPPTVVEAVAECLARYCGNPGRGAHPLSLACAEKIYDCRVALADFFGAEAPERVLFTYNTTHALNLAIKGLFRAGDHVLISELEHNAVRRPLCALQRTLGVSFECFPVVGLSASQILAQIARRLRPNTAGVVCTHASNICSLTLPLSEIGSLCRGRGLLFVVDAAQSAGHLPLDMRQMQIDALAVPAHKALYGIQGAGALLLASRADPTPLLEGGSGSDSLSEQMPALPPERYEAGTLATPAIVGILTGLNFVRERGLEAIAAHERALFRAARERLEAIPQLTVYEREQEGAVLLFNHAEYAPEEIARRLSKEGICVRAGYHCAPLAHKALGTAARGAVRLGFGAFNTLAELDTLWKALK
jgi:cysteine desulfurase family protein